MNNRIDLLDMIKPTIEDTNLLFPHYLSGLSHDIRTPLSAIVGFSDLLAEPRVSRADQRSYCQMIARSSRKLLDLMSNLIDLAKMDTGNLELFYRDFFFKDFIEDIKMDMDEFIALYEKTHLEISYIAPAESSSAVFIDRGRLLQIVKILMENSLRFTKDGSVSLVIKQNSPGICSIEVTDTGCGMDKETIKNLFQMFPRNDSQLGGKMKARGLSLNVVKRLCDMMNISIVVNSQVGIGTTVRLVIPGKMR